MLGIELAPEHPVDRLTELGVAAEDAGYDAVLSAHHYNNRDPFAALTRIAAETEAVRVGPGVANPLEIHPATLASKVATLAEVSDGRALFGIGPGDSSTLRNLGLAEDRGLRPVLEAFRVARKLWAGERVTHDGTFRAKAAGLNYEPPGEIPVYVGGEGPQMCRMAAKHADGLLFNASHPEDLAWARERVEAERSSDGDAEQGDGAGSAASGENREASGEERETNGEFDLAAYASVSVAEDRDAAREAARPPVAFIAAGAAPPVLGRHGIDADRAAAIGDRISAGEFSEAFERVTPAMIDAFSAAGTPDEVADRLAALLEHADSIVVGSPLGPDLEAAVTLAAAAYRRATR